MSNFIDSLDYFLECGDPEENSYSLDFEKDQLHLVELCNDRQTLTFVAIDVFDANV